MLRTLVLIVPLAVGSAFAADVDSDRDGLSDRFEQALFERFAPRFHISAGDCDLAPAEFVPDSPEPRVKSRNGTVYGQVFPAAARRADGNFVEIHFYHLWAQDCGMKGHALDAEAVYALVRADRMDSPAQDWNAEFWLAAAHEDTLCDVSNGARAAALAAVDRGPDVWVSRAKHASFLDQQACARGCGRDVCDDGPAMAIANLINLGEAGAPMNGSGWSQAGSWPLASKMAPQYTDTRIARLPVGATVELVPARAVPRGGRTTIDVAARVYSSLASADTHTQSGASAGIESAGSSAEKTGHAMKAASSATRRWLKGAFAAIAPPAPR
jgi:hypothetical protein